MFDDQPVLQFNAIRLKLASPDDIHRWSYGEVTKPETINYRTQKPEKSGLFAEEIFGPSKDWECYCGKYKRIRYKGIVCDKCGVEVTRAIVRRERMGHIDLAAPVSHIWFLRGVPSQIGLALDLSIMDLEKVIYFANFIITKVNDDLRKETLAQLDGEAQAKRKMIDGDFTQQTNQLKQKQGTVTSEKEKGTLEKEIVNLLALKVEQLKALDEAVDTAKRELKTLAPLQIVSEQIYQDLSLKYGHVFEASIGAEAIRKLLGELVIKNEIKKIEEAMVDCTENKRRRLIRRLRLFKNLELNDLRPEWMIMAVVPIIPPDLRPMVQLDGGRFATSDLNDLYRRVINRNNRLKRLIELNAPEVIQRNEKRMLQEAVDALIDNGARHGKTVTASTGQKRMLKSIADMLKGKQGRFRQNLLGKRVDYSGRSVIVIGPHLKLWQCGIPKRMALELFRPFVISQLIKREYVHNVRSAGRFIESGRPEIWDILEEVTKNAHVLLNRAPTLHRLGIQAFQPILIEGKAIQIHPLVCSAFNADFDGDQMAVHVPLTEQAKWEAENIMLSSKNLLKPATGTPVVSPNQDIVLGCFYMSQLSEPKSGTMRAYGSDEEAIMAYQTGNLHIQEKLILLMNGEKVETNVGRILFNQILPESLRYTNKLLDKKTLTSLISRSLAGDGLDRTVLLLDDIKKLAFNYLTNSGVSWGMDDLPLPPQKKEILAVAEKEVEQIHQLYQDGLLTDMERRVKVIKVWTLVREHITELSKGVLDPLGPVYSMIASGARGSWAQITQMMGMKGMVTNPAGETIELPVKASFKEGLDVLEYFISTHGTRKGLSDTALRTANAGYLTRRLIDVAQDVVIKLEDCGDTEGVVLTKKEAEEMNETLAQRVWSRVVAQRIVDPETKKVIVQKDHIVTTDIVAELEKLDLPEIKIRSALTCKALEGLCQKCYGYDLGVNRMVELWVAVGIIAAQSIGEPGTQLTMRTFHTGGVAGQDITQGLPRVEELFEVRPVKRASILSEVAGVANIVEGDGQKIIKINYRKEQEDRYDLPKSEKDKAKFAMVVKDKAKVKAGDVLFTIGEKETTAEAPGRVEITDTTVWVRAEVDAVAEYPIPVGYTIWIKNGDLVNPGDQLTEGSINLEELFHLKGQIAVQKYIIREIQYIYSSQGQKLNDKHVEVIVRQLFSRVFVPDAGDTDLVAGEIVERTTADLANAKAIKEGKKPAKIEYLLMGITKSSLSTDSFLSAASFQETARVLINAAISGRIDDLKGLKENVIIGKLIPAGTGMTMKDWQPEPKPQPELVMAPSAAPVEPVAELPPVEPVEEAAEPAKAAE